MKKSILSVILVLGALLNLEATTVYTKINSKPTDGWAGNNGQYSSQKYIIVYEKSDTKGLVWDGTDGNNNYVEVTIADGKITSEDLADYQVSVTEEKSNRFYLKAKNGYMGSKSGQNSLLLESGGKECTLQSNGGYVMLETNTNTCRFLCYEPSTNTYRYRFYYDSNKKWADTDKHNICFYVLGEVEQQEPQNQLDINYVHVEMYACESKFPTQSNPYDQYFMTFMFLAQKEENDAVPQIGLEFLAPTQYSIEGTYKSDFTPGQKYFLNCQAGSKHSYFIFPNKSEQGWGEASLKLAEMKVTKVGKSTQPNAYVYHIKLVFTDSNNKIWTLDKDLDVYAWWIDCNRQTDPVSNMPEVAFALESGNHTTESSTATETVTPVSDAAVKTLQNGQLIIIRDGISYSILGAPIK